MKKTFCDWCEKEMQDKDIKRLSIIEVGLGYKTATKYYDICPGCSRRVLALKKTKATDVINTVSGVLGDLEKLGNKLNG